MDRDTRSIQLVDIKRYAGGRENTKSLMTAIAW